MKIAGQTARISALFDSTAAYCRPYFSEDAPDFSVTVTRDMLIFEQDALDQEAREEGFRLRTFTDPFLERAAIQRAFAEHLFGKNVLLLHGSAVAVDGNGYLFMARSGTGKSTHTRFWRELFGERATMINDDKPFVCLRDDGVRICGSPWSGKHGLDANVCVPLQGICILQRGSHDTIRPITPDIALEMLRKQAYCPLSPEKLQIFLHLVDKLSIRIPLWQMECTKSPQAAQVAWAAMSAGESG